MRDLTRVETFTVAGGHGLVPGDVVRLHIPPRNWFVRLVHWVLKVFRWKGRRYVVKATPNAHRFELR